MSYKINLYVSITILIISLAHDSHHSLTVNPPDEIVNSFKSAISSDYIRSLAQEFATKAAEHFMTEIKSKEKEMARGYGLRIPPSVQHLHEIYGEKKSDSHSKYKEDERKKIFEKFDSYENKESYHNKFKDSYDNNDNYENNNNKYRYDNKDRHDKKNSFDNSNKYSYNYKNSYDNRGGYHKTPKILSEKEAMVLLNEPYPDGDNLDEYPELSDANEEESLGTKPLPVIGIMKINGVYYRRLLGII